MATRIVHFGVDECNHVLVLASRGYEVEECGTSVPKLNDALQQDDFDALVVTEDGLPCSEEVIAKARSCCSAPLILFEGVDRKYEPRIFDLVVPRLTPTTDWLTHIAKVIEQTRAIHANSRRVREQSASLRQETASVRQETASLREEAASLRQDTASLVKQSGPAIKKSASERAPRKLSRTETHDP